jgi:regulator of RNase E activity RraA
MARRPHYKERTVDLYPLLTTNRKALRSKRGLFLAGALVVPCLLLALLLHGQTFPDVSVYANDPVTMLAGYRHVEVSSVSDAIEQLTGQRQYMTHHMQPIFTTKFAGYAVTVKLVKEENHDPNALTGMLSAIDQGAKDSVYVMTVQDGADIAGMGGLMGTAMSAREFAGAIIDGGVRDVAYLRKIGFPVYASGIVPSTSAGHYRVAGTGIPVVCDGVKVNAGDIVAADSDGVVVVPREIAPKVLVLSQQLDFKEHSMYAYIENTKSIQEAVKKFGRL